MKIKIKSDTKLIEIAKEIALQESSRFKFTCPPEYHNEKNPEWIYLCKTRTEADEMKHSPCVLCQVCDEIIVDYYGQSTGSGPAFRAHFATQIIQYLIEKRNSNLTTLPPTPGTEISTLNRLESDYSKIFQRIKSALQIHQKCTKLAITKYSKIPKDKRIRIHRSITKKSEKDVPISSWSHQWGGTQCSYSSYGRYLYTAAVDFENIFSIAGQEFELLILSDSLISDKKIIKSFAIDLNSGELFNF